jgi:hypothetical protein
MWYGRDMVTGDAPRKLRLMKLDIRDFRGIDKLSLDFTDADGDPLDLLVFAGGNGSGKTAVLEAILLLLAGNAELLPKDSAPLHEQIRFGAKESMLAAKLRFVFVEGVQVADFTAHLTLHPPTQERSRLETEPYVLLPDGSRRIVLEEWSGHPVVWPSIEYFSSRREPVSLGVTPDMTGAGSSSEADRLRELKRRLVSVYYRSLRAARQSGPSSDGPIKRLQRFWERFDGEGRTLDVIPVDNNPGSGDEVILRDARPIPEDITSLAMARRLSPTRPDIPPMVPLDRLSSGQMELFALAGPIIFRDQPPDIVLIDEPEHHMHVQWQRHLVSALRELSPGTQFIIATHSEEILDAALSYERFILVDDDDPRAHLKGDSEEEDEDEGHA